MRVLLLSQWFDPEPGAVRGLPLARWLRDQGHDVTVLTGFPNYPGGKVYPGYKVRWRQWEEMDGVRVLRVPLYPNHSQSALGRVANYGSFAVSAATLGAALAPKADVAFVYHPPATVGFPAAVLKMFRRMPFVYHVADMWPESVVESGMLGHGFRKRVTTAVLARWCKWVYGRAHSISVLSPGFKRLLVERGVPAEKVHVIYNWTDEAVFRPVERDTALAEQLGLAGKFNIVYAGILGAFQGLETVLKAAARLQHLPEIQFVLAGTGQKEAELRALAGEMRLTNVHFLPNRPFREMPQLNALADVLLIHLKDLPFFTTTIPSKTQVSLASGRPILAAVRGDAADVIERARAGLTCAPEDDAALAVAAERMFRMGADTLEQMGRRGREFYLREMSLAVGGRATEALLAAACGQPLDARAPHALPTDQPQPEPESARPASLHR